MIETKNIHSDKLLNTAFALSLVTIFYNLLEGGVSTYFGSQDETIALFGFGLDSFVEVISGVGIAHMIYRMKKHPLVQRDKFEKNALQVTGSAFYILAGGLAIGSGISIYSGAEPETTIAGIIISGLSILTMYFLYRSKLKVGRRLNSAPVISDAKCTKTCFYLSFILLVASVAYEVFKIPFVDAIGSLGIAWYAFREGKEAFEKAHSTGISCADDCC